jgi:hypothetical protein
MKVMVYKSLVSHENEPIWKPYSISAIAYHSHLYTQILNGKENDELERWFSQEFESPASRVIDAAISDQRLTKEDWYILIRFLAAQDVRTPSRMRQHIEWGMKSAQDVLNKVLDDVKEKLANEGATSLKRETESYQKNPNLFPLKLITESQPDSDIATLRAETFIGRSSWIHSIRHLLENTSHVLHKHKWSIVKPAKGYYWFTSDNPVIKLNYINSLDYDLLGGWGRDKGNIFFPIGPEHAMFTEIGAKPFPKGTRLSVNLTLQLRKFIAENSYRMIFSFYEDPFVLHLKRRVIDNERVKKEREEMQNWHLANAHLEQEYFTPNKPKKKE